MAETIRVKLKDGRRLKVHLNAADAVGLQYLAENAEPTTGVKLRDGSVGTINWSAYDPAGARFLAENVVGVVDPPAPEKPDEDAGGAPWYTWTGIKERGSELVSPEGGAGPAAARFGISLGQKGADLGSGLIMLVSNVLPAGVEARVQEKIRSDQIRGHEDFERLYEATGGRDIYSSLGGESLIMALLGPSEKLIAGAAPFLRPAAKTELARKFTAGAISGLPKKELTKMIAKDLAAESGKGAARGAITGAGYEAVASGGDPEKVIGGAIGFGLLGGATAGAGRAMGYKRMPGFQVWRESFKSPAVKTTIDDMRKAFPDITDEQIVGTIALDMAHARKIGQPVNDVLASRVYQAGGEASPGAPRLLTAGPRGNRFLIMEDGTTIDLDNPYATPYTPRPQQPKQIPERTARRFYDTGKGVIDAESPYATPYTPRPRQPKALPPAARFESNPGGGVDDLANPKLYTGTPDIAYPDMPTRGMGVIPENNTLFSQSGRANVRFTDDGKAVITGFSKATIGDLTHELGHVWRRELPSRMLREAERAFGVVDGKWTRHHEELFARAFEKYMATGRAPNSRMEGTFNQFKAWLGDVYRGVNNSPLETRISPEMHSVFRKMTAGGGPLGDIQVALSARPWAQAMGDRKEHFIDWLGETKAGGYVKALRTLNKEFFSTIDQLYVMDKSLGDMAKRVLGGPGQAFEVLERNLLKAFEPVRNTKEMVGGKTAQWFVHDLAAARRWVELSERGIEVSPEMAANAPKVLQVFERLRESNPQLAAQVDRAAIGLVNTSREIPKYWLKNGVISFKQYNDMIKSNAWHVPFNRVLTAAEKKAAAHGGLGASTGRASGFRRITGSDKPVQDVVENLIENYMTMIPKANQHVFRRKVIDWMRQHAQYKDLLEKNEPIQKALNRRMNADEAELMDVARQAIKDAGLEGMVTPADLGATFKVTTPLTQLGPNDVAFLHNGKWQVWTIKDTIIADSLRKSNRAQFVAELFDTMPGHVVQGMKKLKRAGVVLTPMFTARNAVRDIQTALLNDPTIPGGLGFYPEAIKHFIGEYMPALYKVATKQNDAFYRRLMAGGAGNSEFRGRSAGEIQTLISRAHKDPTKYDIALDWAKHPLQTMEAFAGVFEQAPRYAAAHRRYKLRLSENVPEAEAFNEAVIAYRNITADFGEMGQFAAEIGKASPFFTAHFAGMKAELRAVKAHPKEYFSKAAQLLAIPTLGLWAMNKDEDWYKSLDPAYRNMYWWITPTVRIPKPYGIPMVIASGLENVLNHDNENNTSAVENIYRLVQSTFVVNPKPTLLSMRDGLKSGKHPYFGTPIEPKYSEDLPKYQRYGESTSEVAKWLPNMLMNTTGLSPAQIDFLIAEAFGGMGRLATKGIDSVATGRRKGIRMTDVNPFNPDNPLESDRSGALNTFYDNLATTKSAYNEIYSPSTKATPEQVERARAARGWQADIYDQYMLGQGRVMSNLRAEYTEILNDESLDEKTRRQKLAKKAREINRFAIESNVRYERYREMKGN